MLRHERALMASPPEFQRLSRLVSLAEVYACVAALAHAVAPRSVDVGDAAGKILAADVLVKATLPPRPTALRDGWAVTSDAVSDAGSYAPGGAQSRAQFCFYWRSASGRRRCGAAARRGDRAKRNRAGDRRRRAWRGRTRGRRRCEPADPLRCEGERLREIDIVVLRTAKIARDSSARASPSGRPCPGPPRRARFRRSADRPRDRSRRRCRVA